MSSEDLLARFDEFVKRFKNEFDEIIAAERAKMKAEVEAFNEEKKRMQAFAIRDDDIVRLNVGGQKFTSKRSTLCQVEGSLFATMFSGRWEDSVERDQDGAVYFDFNPQHFSVILDYLRVKKIATFENPATVFKIPEDQVKNFKILVEYLGLGDEIFPTEIVPDEKFNLHSPGVTLEEDRKVAVHDTTSAQKYVLGENIYRQGIVNIKLKMESFKNEYWMFTGILEGEVTPDQYSYMKPGSYGWLLGTSSLQGACKNGSITKDSTFIGLLKQRDEFNLILNFDTAKLSLHLTTGQQFHIDILKNKTWRLNVTMYSPNDRIRIINE